MAQVTALTEERAIKMAQLRQAEADKWRLLLQLHKVQEAQEQSLLEYSRLEKSHEQLENRIHSLLTQYPECWEYESLKINYNPGDAHVDWCITNVYLANRLISKLNFRTTKVSGVTGIIFPATSPDNTCPLIRRPYNLNREEPLELMPQNGSLLQGNNASFTNLGTTDWASVIDLVNRMIHVSRGEVLSRQAPTLNCMDLAKGLTNLTETLSKWPLVLRYDSIKLQGVKNEANYHSLSIHMTNVSFGEQTWPELWYTLSTVSEDNVFGQNPRIEFPEKTRNAIINWYAESNDHRGPRLELRFAQPNHLDTLVWKTLAEKDRCLVTALVNYLPLQISEIRKEVKMPQRWDEWYNVAQNMRSILASHAKNHAL